MSQRFTDMTDISAINPFVAFYIRGNGKVLFFCTVPDTIRDITKNDINIYDST
jgi:hypothetical protein